MKTNNYLGRHDENRGIIIFFIIFAIVLLIIGGITILNNAKEDKENEGITSIDQMVSMLENEVCDVEKFEINENKLVLEGVLQHQISGSILSKLKGIQVVLKNKDGDKYEYDTDYYISTEKIDFSSVKEGNQNSEIDLDAIEKGEYYVFLRLKYESTKSESGYRYLYYTLRSNTDTKHIEYNTMKISFGSSKRVSDYLTIIYE